MEDIKEGLLEEVIFKLSLKGQVGVSKAEKMVK